MSQSPEAKKKAVNVPLRMTEELYQRVTATAEQLGLSKQDTMRLSMERGLKVLVAQLTSEIPTQA